MATIPKDIRAEIATIARDPQEYLFGGVLTNHDDTMLSRGGGKGLKIYDEIERDCHAFAVLQKRKLAIIAREWDVLPASKSAVDKRAADMVREQLTNLKLDQVCLKLLDATLKGYSIGETMWATDGAEIVASQVKVKPQRRFVFGEDQAPRLLTRDNLWTGEPLPARKFIVHRYGDKDDDNPYGLGLGYRLFWPVFFKRQDITFWLTFVDKFAAPTAMGEYPPGTSEADQKKLLEAVGTIASEGGIIVPQGMMVKLLEAARSGSIDTYERLARYMDEQISECVLGETLSTNIGSSGSLAAAKTHNEVRIELAKGDADLLSDTLNESLIKWIVELNMPGANPPKLWRDFAEEEDLKERSETDKNLSDMGFEADEQYINETYGGKWKRKQPKKTEGKQDFAEGEGQATIEDALLAWGKEHTAQPAASMIDAAEQLLGKVGSLEEFRDRLIELFAASEPERLGEIMARLDLLGNLVGRAEASQE